MGEVLPEYDRQRVYQSDIKKLANLVRHRESARALRGAADDEPSRPTSPRARGGVRLARSDEAPTPLRQPTR
ncbi:MAG: hypothetical protein WKG07_47465 [Hymenobacter sp.]